MKQFPVRSALAVLLAAALLFTAGCAPSAAPEPAKAEYPKMAPYPDESKYFGLNASEDPEEFSNVYNAWREDQLARWDRPEGYTDGLAGFFGNCIPVLLSGSSGNPVCSPLNIYMALAMLAEITGNNSREQILDTLNASSLDALRSQAGHVWNAHYSNDGANFTILANSLWAREGLSLKQATVNTLTEHYYASVFQGDLGSKEMNQQLQQWLNEQTGGLLEEQVQNVSMDPQTVMALASTIFYRVKWRNEFMEEWNTQDTFHGPSGDSQVTFMNRQLSYGPYFWGEGFAAAYLPLEDDSKMWLILPDEGSTPADILNDGEALDLVLNHWENTENQKSLKVNLSMPKFDIAADVQLTEALKTLGITDVFHPESADFSAILPEDPAWLDQVKHAARVTVDEEGVSAAACTVMMMCGAAMPPEEEVDFILDRPFLFLITSRDDMPLFAGIVNQP